MGERRVSLDSERVTGRFESWRIGGKEMVYVSLISGMSRWCFFSVGSVLLVWMRHYDDCGEGPSWKYADSSFFALLWDRAASSSSAGKGILFPLALLTLLFFLLAICQPSDIFSPSITIPIGSETLLACVGVVLLPLGAEVG